MNRLFHLRIRSVGATGKEFETSNGDIVEQATFDPSPDFNNRKEQLYDRAYPSLADQDNACAALGEVLFRAFFCGGILATYRAYEMEANGRTRIALHLPASLYGLPWEVLRDPQQPPGQFLAMSGSIVRYDGDDAKPSNVIVAPRSRGAMEVLFIRSNPEDNPVPEFDLFDTELFRFSAVNPATYENFRSVAQRRLESLDGFLFFGHGEVDQDNLGTYVFVRDQRFRFMRSYPPDRRAGHTVSDVLGMGKRVRLACILACESAWARCGVAFENSLAGALIRGTWLPFVIGMQTEIDYFAVRQFLNTMISELERDPSLDLAMSTARVEIHAISTADAGKRRSNRDWWVPVLYARSSNFEIYSQSEDLPEIVPADQKLVPAATQAASLSEVKASLTGLLKPLTSLFSAYERSL